MQSGTFHVASQAWRYFSREKSLAQTLHISQLVTGTPGDTVLIDSVSPAATPGSNGFSVPPLSFTGAGGRTVNITQTTTTLSTCLASVGPNRTELARKNCIIQYGVWNDTLKEILFTPQESGWFMLHGEFNSGLQAALWSQGTSWSDGSFAYGNTNSFSGKIDRQPVGFTSTQIAGFGRTFRTDQGSYPYLSPFFSPPTPPNTPWNPDFWISSIVSGGITQPFEGIAGRYFRIALTNNCNPAAVTSDLTAWLFKFAEAG